MSTLGWLRTHHDSLWLQVIKGPTSSSSKGFHPLLLYPKFLSAYSDGRQVFECILVAQDRKDCNGGRSKGHRKIELAL
jgi:hypothetical protein